MIWAVTERALSLTDAAGLPRCETCIHFRPEADYPLGGPRHDIGTCTRWARGYHPDLYSALPDDGCLVEDDEGWGCIVGIRFGCVLHEPK